jgi:hypothetical protein
VVVVVTLSLCDQVISPEVKVENTLWVLNPTQCEALAMIAVQMMANDVAVGFGGAGGYLEMNVYKPLMIFNIANSITIATEGCTSFRRFLVEGTSRHAFAPLTQSAGSGISWALRRIGESLEVAC